MPGQQENPPTGKRDITLHSTRHLPIVISHNILERVFQSIEGMPLSKLMERLRHTRFWPLTHMEHLNCSVPASHANTQPDSPASVDHSSESIHSNASTAEFTLPARCAYIPEEYLMRQLPPYSNDPVPDYCPPYIILSEDSPPAFLQASKIPGYECWAADSPPLDTSNVPIQLYLRRRLVINHENLGIVAGYGVPRQGHILLTIQDPASLTLFTLYIREEWVEESLRDQIAFRQGRGEIEINPEWRW
jgi:hypothetical protein